VDANELFDLVTGATGSDVAALCETQCPCGYPVWQVWVLWTIGGAGLVVVLTGIVKQWFGLKKTQKWIEAGEDKRAKLEILGPFLLLFGTITGVVYHEAGMMQSWLLCHVYGAVIGAFSFALYDAGLKIIDVGSDLIIRRFGGRLASGWQSLTGKHETVDGEIPSVEDITGNGNHDSDDYYVPPGPGGE